MTTLDQRTIERLIDDALKEDLGSGDQTSAATLGEKTRLHLVMATREDIIVAGLDIAAQVFKRLAPYAHIQCLSEDGARVARGGQLMKLEGPARALLSAERTALNIVQMLSGIATETGRFVDAIAGSGATLLDTRKTIPGLRALSKYATRMGGATNHRMRLDDGVLIKDNHIAVAGSVAMALKLAQEAGLKDIEVECDTLEQVAQALAAGADKILLDNMSIEELKQAVEMSGGRIPLEASGGVNLKTIGAIAKTGVDFISVGHITQSAGAVDIGLDIIEPQ
ncbi:MAG: carboxylating nicotinate-nucleotide diphosphorylase [Rhodospirillaceae bacterium]|nr:carboxylating nicotinate-nucleotide diphosphorylase [Rhodospirillaceae bacterium]MBL6930116.1 carboxylating nicotinate-nucleotide diphosphorylase [Rhodospirillales bacterium]MBL6940898.1 carboxylating nicotinate-nucleotide diphosphorylase [Rhodospirillales bacterium]